MPRGPVDQRLQPDKGLRGTARPDNHRKPACARQHGDMAGWAPCCQDDGTSTAPIDLEEPGQRQVFSDNDRTRGNFRSCGARQQVLEHAIANIVEVGGARGKNRTFGSLVSGCLFGHRRVPRCTGRGSGGDGVERRPGELIVVEHGVLEAENVCRVTFGTIDKRLDLRARLQDRPQEGRPLLLRRNCCLRGRPGNGRADDADRTERQARRGAEP